MNHEELNEPPKAQPSSIERFLNPRSLLTMMATGGGLLVLGLIGWLWSSGIFDDPFVVAATLGSVNLALLGSGVFLSTQTRHKVAGRGLTLLSSLLLPLNLWFYNSQGLITLSEGRLWIPALVICGIYALIARATKDALSIYTLIGGTTLTGMLFIADPQLAPEWAAIPAAAFLAIFGAMCVQADRLFERGDGPFRRESFGKAFFNSGVLLVCGSLVVLCCHWAPNLATSAVYRMQSFYQQLATDRPWSLGILFLAAVVFSQAHRTRRRGALYPTLGALTAGLSVLATLDVSIGYIERLGTFWLITGVTGIGLMGLIVNRWRTGNPSEDDVLVMSQLENFSNRMIVAGSSAAALFSIFQVLADSIVLSHISLLLVQLVVLTIARNLSRFDTWKSTFRGMRVVTIMAGFGVTISLPFLNLMQRMELVSVLVGTILVGGAYFGKSNEDSKREAEVTSAFVFGSLLLVLPIMAGLFAIRVLDVSSVPSGFRYAHDIGGLVVGLLLLGSGVLARVRSTTLAGASLLTWYVVSIFGLIHWPDQLQSISVLMMIGGGAFFVAAALLSIFRDYVLALPDHVRNRKGLFRVFDWR